MNERDALRAVLASLNKALLASQHQLVERLLTGSELTTILCQNAVSIARAESQAHLVQFLCTLAIHNNVETERAQHWLDVYQAIAGKELSYSLAQLSRNNVLRLTIDAIKYKKSLKASTFKKVKGNDTMWIDSIDIAIDHHDWQSAITLVECFGKIQQETRSWLLISKHLSTRHPLYVDQTGFQKVDIDYNRLSQIYYLCISALYKYGLNDAVNALKPLQANALEIAGNFDAATKILKSIQNNSTHKKTETDIARIKCKQGDLVGSIEYLDMALLKLEGPDHESKQIAELFVEGEKKQGAIALESNFTISAAQRALSDLMEVANTNGLDIFLVSGTLLGCVREGTFLGHDKDIDVGIVGWENQYTLYIALIQSGIFTFNAQFLKGKNTIYLPMRHKVTGIWIDIFVYHPIGDKLMTGVDFFFGYRQTFSFTPFELEKRNFADIPVMIPKNYELNLEENFGNWKSPDVGYISHLESPSTDNKGALPFMLTARLTAYRAIVREDHIKIRKILSIMDKHLGKQGSLPLELSTHLNRLATKFEFKAKEKSLEEKNHV